jgi:hypothetical protein
MNKYIVLAISSVISTIIASPAFAVASFQDLPDFFIPAVGWILFSFVVVQTIYAIYATKSANISGQHIGPAIVCSFTPIGVTLAGCFFFDAWKIQPFIFSLLLSCAVLLAIAPRAIAAAIVNR